MPHCHCSCLFLACPAAYRSRQVGKEGRGEQSRAQWSGAPSSYLEVLHLWLPPPTCSCPPSWNKQVGQNMLGALTVRGERGWGSTSVSCLPSWPPCWVARKEKKVEWCCGDCPSKWVIRTRFDCSSVAMIVRGGNSGQRWAATAMNISSLTGCRVDPRMGRCGLQSSLHQSAASLCHFAWSIHFHQWLGQPCPINIWCDIGNRGAESLWMTLWVGPKN